APARLRRRRRARRLLAGGARRGRHGAGGGRCYPLGDAPQRPRVRRPRALAGAVPRAPRAGARRMKFLFTTLQTYESDFYGRVGAELARRGHDVAHLTVSRRAARLLGGRSVHDVIAELPAADPWEEAARIEAEYGLPAIRDADRR